MSGHDHSSETEIEAAAGQSDPSAPSIEDPSASSEESAPISGSDDARLLAGVILEVLGGVRTPTEASEILNVTTARFYQLESRAVAGLVAACEPRSRGPQVDYAVKWERAVSEVTGLKQEVARLTALLRAAQQAYGVTPMPADRARQAKAAKKAGKRAKRRPGIRALKARDRLDGSVAPDGPGGDAGPGAAT